MKTRILFSVALVAVLFIFWLIMSKPVCLAGEAASLGPRLEWNCLRRQAAREAVSPRELRCLISERRRPWA